MSFFFRTLGGSGTMTVQHNNKSLKQARQYTTEQIANLIRIVKSIG